MAATQGVTKGTTGSTALGERLRTLRKQAGLTQTELAAPRFSKEYVSQIELGKTRPSSEALEWLASRLDVDPLFLETGVSADERGRIEATLARGEALVQSQSYDEAAEEFRRARALAKEIVPELELRALNGEAWAQIRRYDEPADLKGALDLLGRARELSEKTRFSDVDRADVLFRLGVCRYKLASLQTAVSLLTEALTLAEKSGLPCDRLRSDIFRWRARCYRRQRDWEGAREDVERALELSEALGDRRAVAQTYFQASIIAERNGHWALARSYAERARSEFEQLEDEKNVGRLLNNLGGLNHLLGKPKEAVRLLKDAFRVAVDTDNDVDAAYAVSSLARVHLDSGAPALAEEQARKALDLLGNRIDYLEEIGNAQLTLGRALMQQARLDEADTALREADKSFEQIQSPGHRSAGWVARGDLAARQGDYSEAARLYRQAADVLQDVRF